MRPLGLMSPPAGRISAFGGIQQVNYAYLKILEMLKLHLTLRLLEYYYYTVFI